MTPQERELLIQMFQRIDAAGDQPRDREAEDLIADAVRQLPFAPYLLAQTVLVQEEALKAAAARIEQLEAGLKKMDEPPRGGSFLGSGSSIFGSRPSTSVPSSGTSPWGRNARDAVQDQAAPAPFPSTAPQQPMAQAAAAPQGNSFLRGALGAAARGYRRHDTYFTDTRAGWRSHPRSHRRARNFADDGLAQIHANGHCLSWLWTYDVHRVSGAGRSHTDLSARADARMEGQVSGC